MSVHGSIPPLSPAWQWVTEADGQQVLRELSAMGGGSLQWNKWLRKREYTPDQIRVLIEQLTLRPLAANKFDHAADMYFQRQLLEQATDERIAHYKAGRFTEASSIVDVCCGLGGDLIALAGVASQVCGVDASELACHLASTNCRVSGVNPDVVCRQAEGFDLDQSALFHIDPDRRATGKRTTRAEHFAPNVSFLTELIENHQHGGIKLAPASDIPVDWQHAERQWIGNRNECKQQMLWFGRLANNPGLCSAAAVDRDGSTLFEWVATSFGNRDLATEIGPFVYEPHPTIIAGRMVGNLGVELDLERLAPDIAYLTGARILHRALTAFEVLDRVRIDKRQVDA
ncbi:MAG: hypothetical protein ACR2NP_07430, partial [Pirellulaceae bacterium]